MCLMWCLPCGLSFFHNITPRYFVPRRYIIERQEVPSIDEITALTDACTMQGQLLGGSFYACI